MSTDRICSALRLATETSENRAWVQPEVFDLSNTKHQCRFEGLLDGGVEVVDRAPALVSSMFSIEHPESAECGLGREEYIKSILSGDGYWEYGKWVYFPWLNELRRYPDRDDWLLIRTERNRNLFTAEEHRILGGATIAAYGLSVGSNILISLAISGVGDKYILGDPDVIDPTNLNRMPANLKDVGTPKVDWVGRVVSEIDPYIHQVHERGGFTDRSPKLLDSIEDLSIIVEEVDNISTKYAIRRYASERHDPVPVLMGTDAGHNAMIDIERYDTEARVRPFLGKVSRRLLDSLGAEPTDSEVRKATTRLVGVTNASPRLIESVMSIGRDTTGNPQLYSTSLAVAGLSVEAIRAILLQPDKIKSGRYRLRLGRKLWGTRTPDGLPHAVRTLQELIGYTR